MDALAERGIPTVPTTGQDPADTRARFATVLRCEKPIDMGFVTIRGRAQRFAKIGGEMVSLPAVEA